MKINRIICAILALCMLLPATAVFASAATVVESGVCGENLIWTLDDQGTLTISGEGAMPDYENWDPALIPWYTKDVISVVIEPGITHIGDLAFGDLPDLESVSIANTVTSIGNSAFMFTGLRNVVLPDSVTTVGENAFNQCTDLETVVLSANLTEIPKSMFFACGKLKQIVIPKSVTSIGDNSFAICTSLKNVLIQGQPTYLGNNVFVGCGSLSKIVLPEGITTLYTSTFERCTGLKEITIPSTVTKINMAAFVECDALETVYYSGTLEQWDSISIDNKHNDPLLNAKLELTSVSIVESGVCGNSVVWTLDDQGTLTISGEGAMMDFGSPGPESTPWFLKNVVSVVIEPGVTHIGDRAFQMKNSVKKVAIANTVTSIGKFAFSDTGLQNVVLPDSVTTVGNSAFSNNIDLETVVLSANLEEIPKFMFFCCEKLQNIVIPKSVTAIGNNSLSTCTSLESVEIQGTLTYLGEYAFAHSASLSEIVLPKGIATLYTSTFEDCTGLKEITIPSTVTQINMGAFVTCNALETVYYIGSMEQWKAISIDERDNEALLNAELICKPAPVNPFEDVTEDAYYFQPVLWAVDNEITSGYKDGDFKPSKLCTRAEVVTFLWRAAGKPEPTVVQNTLSDLDENAYYYKAVQWAVEQGITSGYKDSTFRPSKSCTRAEVITFLWRAAGKPQPSSSQNPFPDVSEDDYFFNAVLWAAEQSITSGYKDGEFKPSKICTRAEVITFLWRNTEN